MRKADWIIDLGPGAGNDGGEIIFSGTPDKLLKSKLLTGGYLSGKHQVALSKKPRSGNGKSICIVGATEHNLKKVDVEIPLGMFIAVAGVSGSGKSTLVHDILSRALAQTFYQAKTAPGKHEKITGINHIDKVITVNQDPIGRTPRSNAATYTGVFGHIRDVFAATPEAEKERYSASYFSFNMRGGRCEVCQGGGLKKIEMYLLPDVYIPCEACGGTRYNQKTLTIQYRGKTIADVLNKVPAGERFEQHFRFEKLTTDLAPASARVAVVATRHPTRAFDRLALAHINDTDLAFAVLGNLLQTTEVHVATRP